jgi:hypothetical protein
MDDLDRLYRLLVRNARTAGPDYLARPFELAELYQTLIPYRHYRRELGIETSEDYELALMRLIAGERGYMVSEPEVQQALMRELGSPNPEPSAFRQYAHSHVAFQPDAVRAISSSDGVPVQRASTPSASSFSAPTMPTQPSAPPMAASPMAAPPMPAPPRPTPMMPPVPPPRPSAGMPAPPPLDTHVTGRAPLTIEAHGGCRYCGGTLPDGRRITFCPHCGQNLTLQHCPACGTELEVGWKFCVVCGRGT